MAAQKVDMWFDPICPFAWITSRWLLEASQVRDIDVTWNVMSLAYLNKDREMDAAHTESFAQSWGAVRLVAAVKEKHGNDAVLALYNALGDRIHHKKE
jgi:predicted DsbA family dithiol-disulfide isomerase